ncbi:MAG: Flp pilus assembly protein CpaB [Kiritimatiellae bacterium]|jgi:pilus assembly protein CpaB|nr:Flp pilus assembly protein CpaB [Kiritimatiellia bacterium]
MKQKIIPIVSILAGVLAFMLSIRYFNAENDKLKAERARLDASKALVRVLAVANNVSANTPLTIDDIATVSIPKTTVRDDIMADEYKKIVGRKLIYDIKKGSRLLWSDIEGGSAILFPQLESMIKPGLRAISINVSGAHAVSGMVRPNNRVDVLGTFSFPSKTVEGELEAVTLTVLQDVTVLATGTEMAHKRAHNTTGVNGYQPQKSYSTVTLEVTPREAELLTFAQTVQGRLTLALRNSDDVSFEKDLPEINFELLETSLPELNEYRQKTIRLKKNL